VCGVCVCLWVWGGVWADIFIGRRARGVQTLCVKVCGLCSCLAGDLAYHTNLVDLLTMCTEGKNVATEIKCTSLLPLDEIVRVVTNLDCIPKVCGLVVGEEGRGGGGEERRGEGKGREERLLLLRYLSMPVPVLSVHR